MIQNFKSFFQKKKHPGKNIQYTKISQPLFQEKTGDPHQCISFTPNDIEYLELNKILNKKNSLLLQGNLNYDLSLPKKQGDIEVNIYKQEDNWYYVRVTKLIYANSEQTDEYFECDELLGLLNCIQNEIPYFKRS